MGAIFFLNKNQNPAFTCMQEFSLSDTTAELILTLTEKVTISAPYYLFVFTHTVTKDTVAFIRSEAQDESAYPARYNKFTINPSVVFAGQQPGHWNYEVYEQASAVNTDPELAGEVLEYGKLILNGTVFNYDKYNSPTTFKVYNG